MNLNAFLSRKLGILHNIYVNTIYMFTSLGKELRISTQSRLESWQCCYMPFSRSHPHLTKRNTSPHLVKAYNVPEALNTFSYPQHSRVEIVI